MDIKRLSSFFFFFIFFPLSKLVVTKVISFLTNVEREVNNVAPVNTGFTDLFNAATTTTAIWESQIGCSLGCDHRLVVM